MSKRVLAVSVAIFIAALLVVLIFNNRTAQSPVVNNNGGCDGLQLSARCVPLERAATNPARTKGLSDRDSLAAGTGMLFVFDKTGEQCMWMKDMRFSIDLIWLNEGKKIIKIEQNVAPETYPTAFCADNTKYVIELNSGDIQKAGLAVGQELKF